MLNQTIDILLATYNGERFLGEQLASLLAQSDQDFRIIARDDGSSDKTVAGLERFAAEHPERLLLLTNPGTRSGACGNFAALMRASTGPYVMLCDQDDIWHPDKVAASRLAMAGLESAHGSHAPLLIFSDLRVIDDKAVEIAPSMAAYQRLKLRSARQLNHFLLQNSVTGCTLLANRALIDKSLPVPAEAIMHDHWLALVASAFGSMLAIERPLIDYRQHGANAIGASSVGGYGLVRRFHRLAAAGLQGRLAKHAGQAQAFLDQYRTHLDARQLACCEDFARIQRRSWLGRRWVVLHHGLWMSSAMRNLMLLLTL